MKKIVGLLKPFDVMQTFYVYEDGNELEVVQTRISDIPNTVIELSKTYDAQQVDLVGAKHYTEGIMKQIQQKEFTKYEEYKLIINCI